MAAIDRLPPPSLRVVNLLLEKKMPPGLEEVQDRFK
jgi:hypothetical protein